VTPLAASIALVAHIALLSAISFGGVPGVLPDLRDFVVDRHGWLTNQDFANYFAIVQALPGPNMIMMMSFIGWKVGGLPTAIASALATFAPPCAFAAVVFRWWDRFRDLPWHGAVRRGLAPVTLGLVIAGGAVMGWTGGVGWPGVVVTAVAAAAMLASRINPLWLLGGGAFFGGFGWL
jgi:chromate transporter